MSVSTNPGDQVMIATVAVVTQHGYFDEKAPLGGVDLGSTTKHLYGVVTEITETEVHMMKIDRSGDFSGIVSNFPLANLVGCSSAKIAADGLIK